MSAVPGSQRVRRLVIALAFLLSGFSCLVYEIVWMQMLVAVFGVTYYAIVTIVTSFMAGLALGALVAGRLADRRVSPLAVYVGLELGLALFALAFPLIAQALTGWYPAFRSHVELGFFGISLVRFVVCVLILLLPATAMGATLPLLARYVVRERSRIGADVGMLYGLNTIGAALGCAVTGFFLVWALGLHASNLLAVALTFTAAALVLGVHMSHREPRPPWLDAPGSPAHAPSPAGTPVPAILLTLFFLSGFTSMAYELLWTRVFTMFHTNPQTAVFTLILTLYLLGMGLGSVVYRRIGQGHEPVALFGRLQLAVGLLMVIVLALYSLRPYFTPDVRPSLLHSPTAMWLHDTIGVVFLPWELALALVVVFLPGVLFGLTFPLSGSLYIRRLGGLGRGVGLVYFAITVGGIAGSITAGFFMMPALSLKNSLLVLAAINLCIGGYILGWRPRPGLGRRGMLATGGVTMGALALAGGLAHWMPAWTFLPLNKDDRVIWYADGRNVSSGVVDQVTPSGQISRQVYTSGEQVGGWGGGEQYPLLLSPSPSRVLTVAFGAGGSLAQFARYGTIRELIAVDIDDNQARMLPWLPRAAPVLASDPRFRVVGDDGRNYLFTSPQRFDVLFNDPGTYTLYRELGTREYLTICRDRLTEEGLFFQKLHAEIITPYAFRRAIATFVDVFPEAHLWSAGGPLFFMVGWRAEPDRDYMSLVGRHIIATVTHPAAPPPEDVAARYLTSTDGLRALAGGADPFIDDQIPPMHHLFVVPDITESSEEGRDLRMANARLLTDAIKSVAAGDEFFTDIPDRDLLLIKERRRAIWRDLRAFVYNPPRPGDRHPSAR